MRFLFVILASFLIGQTLAFAIATLAFAIARAYGAHANLNIYEWIAQ